LRAARIVGQARPILSAPEGWPPPGALSPDPGSRLVAQRIRPNSLTSRAASDRDRRRRSTKRQPSAGEDITSRWSSGGGRRRLYFEHGLFRQGQESQAAISNTAGLLFDRVA